MTMEFPTNCKPFDTLMLPCVVSEKVSERSMRSFLTSIDNEGLFDDDMNTAFLYQDDSTEESKFSGNQPLPASRTVSSSVTDNSDNQSVVSCEEDEMSIFPTPIGSAGLRIVAQGNVPFDGNLCSLFEDKQALAALLKPLSDDDDENDSKDQFRPYQEDKWYERYLELVEYRGTYGHCNVPYQWSGNVTLAQWVKRQRHQYKLKLEGRHSNLSQERLDMLKELGFVWDSRAAAWEERFEDLKLFKKENGHCKVTRKHTQHRALALWLKRQRHQCRLCLSNCPDRIITSDQCRRLLDLGLKLNNKRD